MKCKTDGCRADYRRRITNEAIIQQRQFNQVLQKVKVQPTMDYLRQVVELLCILANFFVEQGFGRCFQEVIQESLGCAYRNFELKTVQHMYLHR